MIIHETPSPNWTSRPVGTVITAIILHTTESDTADATTSWFADPTSQVSAHYVVDRDGKIFRCVPEYGRAWHAGESSLWGIGDVNTYSIGIELVGHATQTSFPDAQLAVVVDLCADCVRRYPAIWLNRIVGHEHVALPKGRKNDPGHLFPWQAFLRAVGARG